MCLSNRRGNTYLWPFKVRISVKSGNDHSLIRELNFLANVSNLFLVPFFLPIISLFQSPPLSFWAFVLSPPSLFPLPRHAADQQRIRWRNEVRRSYMCQCRSNSLSLFPLLIKKKTLYFTRNSICRSSILLYPSYLFFPLFLKWKLTGCGR